MAPIPGFLLPGRRPLQRRLPLTQRGPYLLLSSPAASPSLSSSFRARELQDAGLGGRYLPPALRAIASGGSPPSDDPLSVTTPGDGSTLPPTNYPPGFRRARAGTLPSNVQLAAQRFAATTLDSPMDQPQRQAPVNPVPSLAAPARPGLRHAATTVAPPIASSAPIERNSRLRSGSLTLPTLPTGGLSNAFGPSIFSSSWLSTTNGTGSGFSLLDELRSVTSADSGADDFDVHTLDYLGLERDSQATAPCSHALRAPQSGAGCDCGKSRKPGTHACQHRL